MSIRIGARPSRLSIAQVKEFIRYFPGEEFSIIPIKTRGDVDKRTSLSVLENTDFFTYEIEKALIEARVDVAIHSAKDLEDSPPAELVLAAVTLSISSFEALVSSGGIRLKDLPAGSVVGTSSRKRRAAISRFRKDIVIRDIRGNVDERVLQLDNGNFDAIIVAHAALLRLGYHDRISELIDTDIMEPHPLQGRLAVQVRKEREDLISLFGEIHEK